MSLNLTAYNKELKNGIKYPAGDIKFIEAGITGSSMQLLSEMRKMLIWTIDFDFSTLTGPYTLTKEQCKTIMKKTKPYINSCGMYNEIYKFIKISVDDDYDVTIL